MRTNDDKVKIDMTQQNSKYRLWGNGDKLINYITNECSELAQKEYKTRHEWAGIVIHYELCKKDSIWPYEHVVFAQPRICSRERGAQTSLGFWNTNGSFNLGQTTRPTDSQQQKKRTSRIVDFTVPADHWEEMSVKTKTILIYANIYLMIL